ncbi:MAG: Haloacid dehalogenase domain protein hydrolase [Acidobacteriales bacterium]|nr:Haloacid dehalogenase domain protein hydrolase [Terriglobales bacterium]
MNSNPTRNFIDAVLQSKPRIAVFDCDGTLWSNNSGENFFYWSLEQGLVSPEIEKWVRGRYEEYRQGHVAEGVMCGEMTTMYHGLRVEDMEKAAATFFAEVVKPNYFLEMQSLTKGLAAQGCELWAVSSTNEWVIREGIREFDIPTQNVLAATAECINGIVKDKLLRMPSGQGKAVAIREVIQRPVDGVFGNSIHDAAMLEIAKQAYAINPNPDLASIAAERHWTIYWPEKTRAVSASS